MTATHLQSLENQNSAHKVSSSPFGGDQPHISVVSPVYGCEGCLEELVDQLELTISRLGKTFELILVDDASPDNSWARITELAQRKPWIRGFRLARNFGQHAAITAGISQTLGQWVVVMDCDLQDLPSEIPRLYEKAAQGGHNIVFAQRMQRQDTPLKRFSSWSFFKLLTWLTGIHQDSSTANFGIFERKVIDAILRMPERDRCFPLMIKWAGFNTALLPVEHGRRLVGESSYNLRKLLKLALEISLSYSEKPLRMVAACGVGASLFAFILVAYAIFRWVSGDVQVAGFTSIIASIWLTSGLTMFGLGIVGLYVGQIFRNAQGRPSYILAESTAP